MALFLVVCMFPVSAFAADYPLKVNGVQATDANKDNILNCGQYEPLAAAYDPSTNTVTIQQHWNINSLMVEYTGTDALKVVFAGDSVFYRPVTISAGGDLILSLATTSTAKFTSSTLTLTSGGDITIECPGSAYIAVPVFLFASESGNRKMLRDILTGKRRFSVRLRRISGPPPDRHR